MKMSLTSSRIKPNDLQKLKADIITAEQKTGGNEQILADKDLYQEKGPRTNTIVERLFGTGKKDSLKRKKRPTPNSNGFPITHKRFIMGFMDDYKEMVLIQSVGKDRIPDSDEDADEREMDEIRRLNETPKDVLKCQFCGLKTISVDLLLMHTGQCYDEFKARGGKPTKKAASPKKTPAKEKVQRKSKVKEKTPRRQSIKKTPKKSAPKPELNTSNDLDDLVNEWEDNEPEESEEMDHETAETEEKSEIIEKKSEIIEKKTRGKAAVKVVAPSRRGGKKQAAKPKPEPIKTNDVESIAFEWDENEKEENESVKEADNETAEVEKNDKSTANEETKASTEKENCFNFTETEEVEKTSPLRSPVKKPEPESSEPPKDRNANSEDAFKQLMDATQPPDTNNLLKSQQNFPYAKTVKIPDKPQPSKSPTKEPTAIIPKKRIILNNFEQQQLNKATPKASQEKEVINETVKSPEVSLNELKEGIMSKLMSQTTRRTRLGMHSIVSKAEPPKEEEKKEEKEKPKEEVVKVEEKPKVECKSETQPRRFFPSRQRKLTGVSSTPSPAKKEPTKIEIPEKKEEKEEKPSQIEIKESKPKTEEVKEKEQPKIEKKVVEKKEEVPEKREEVPEKREEVPEKKEEAPEKEEEEIKTVPEKVESPKKVVIVPEVEKKEDKTDDKIADKPAKEKNDEIDNEIVFKSANKDSNDDCNISIKTNLTNLNLSKAEEMSAFTLATLSTNIQPVESKLPEKIIETPMELDVIKPLPPPIDESELVPIEGNVTIVPEKVLADGEVELTANAPTATLMNFSMDFSDSSNGTTAKETVKIDPPSPVVVKKPAKKSYERRELLDILEGNQEKKVVPPTKEELDFDDMIPSQIITPKVKESDEELQQHLAAEKSKLMERLTTKETPDKLIKFSRSTNNQRVMTLSTRTQFVQKPKSSKPIILNEEIIKPATYKKRTIKDVEMDHLITKKLHTEPKIVSTTSSAGKAKILQQTIITPAGEIIQPPSATQTEDGAVFDINSMPIFLGDQILTAESMENTTTAAVSTISSPAPREKIIFKKQAPPMKHNKILGTQMVHQKGRQPRILHTMGNKVGTTVTPTSTPSPKNKYVIVSQTPQTKKQTIIKKTPSELAQKLQEGATTTTPTGNKIMIVTNQQGQQQRLLLTPSQQQKYLSYQNSNVKSVVKGNVIQKRETVAGTSGLIKKSPANLLKTQSSHQLVTSTPQMRTTKTMIKTTPQQVQKTTPKPQRTIVIKDQQGHIVRKIQGNDDELLEQQVAEQIEAIKQQQLQQQLTQQQHQTKNVPEILNYRAKTGFRRSYASKSKQQALVKPIVQHSVQRSAPTPPPLAPLSPEKKETVVPAASTAEQGEKASDRPLKQHIIQDSTGNQTSVTEGQILALQLDGESYMLVTCDEAGQLTPLNNEALTQLGPNLPSDLGNIVLQYQKEGESSEEGEKSVVEEEQVQQTVEEQPAVTTAEETVKCEVTEAPGGGQQLIVTGDPIAAQKFLESLTDGNTDFSNILANAEGGILIEHGGQQILINTDNQMILQENQEAEQSVAAAEQNFQVQDILAAALADTGVQPEPNKLAQLSPNGTPVFPAAAASGAQLSLSLNSPIMSPQVQPSTNNKKIQDDDILTHVPKNVDLPITITDPNISSKVAQQQSINNIEMSEGGMNSPSSFVYSLPTLDETVGDLGGQKSFNSMPLLTEDVEEQGGVNQTVEGKKEEGIGFELDKNTASGPSFLDDDGLCTLGGAMCNSLSEPPPDVFDDMAASAFIRTQESVATTVTEQTNQNIVHDNFVLSNNDEQQPLNSSEENSCEIPIQPEIVVSNLTSSDNSNNTFEANTIDENSTNCKFD